MTKEFILCFSTKETESVHQCSTKQQTIANLQQKLPQKLQEQLSAKVIKDKVNESGNKGTELSTFGKPLPVSIGMGSVASTSNNKSFSHDDILSMQRDMNLSDAKTKKMAKHIRVVNGRKSIDPGIVTALVARKRKLENYYHVEDMEYEKKNEDDSIDSIILPTFICHDVPEIVKCMGNERNVNPSNCFLKFSIDKGHDKLKAGLNMIEIESLDLECSKAKRVKYEDGIAPSLHKSASANRMQVLAMVPSIQESHKNLKTLIDNLPGTIYI